MTKKKKQPKIDESYTQHGYSLNRNYAKQTKQKVDNTDGIKNAEDKDAYVCYLSSTFQMLCSNISFVRDVLDYLISHQIILTHKILKNEKSSCYLEELEHMVSHPVLSLFVIIMYNTKVLSLDHVTNLRKLFLCFADHIVLRLSQINEEEEKIIYPEGKPNSLKKTDDSISLTKCYEAFKNNISYYIPGIMALIENDKNITDTTFFEQTRFGKAGEIAHFLEYILLHMAKEFKQHIPIKGISSLVNPVDAHYKLKLKVTIGCNKCDCTNDTFDIDNVYCFPILAISSDENQELNVEEHIKNPTFTEKKIALYCTPNPRLMNILSTNVLGNTNCSSNFTENFKLKIEIVHHSKSLIVNSLRVNVYDVSNPVKNNLCFSPLNLPLVTQEPQLEKNDSIDNVQISSIIMYHPPQPSTEDLNNQEATTEESNVGHYTGLYRRRATKEKFGFFLIDDETVEDILSGEIKSNNNNNSTLSEEKQTKLNNVQQNSCIICYSNSTSTNIYRKVIYPKGINCCILRSSKIDLFCESTEIEHTEGYEQNAICVTINEDSNNFYSTLSFNLDDKKISYTDKETAHSEDTTFIDICIMQLNDTYFSALVVHISQDVKRKLPEFVLESLLEQNENSYLLFIMKSLNIPSYCGNMKYEAYALENNLLSVVQNSTKKSKSYQILTQNDVSDFTLKAIKESNVFNIQHGLSLSDESVTVVAKGIKGYANQRTNTYEFNPSSKDGVGAFLLHDEAKVTSKVIDFYVRQLCSNWNVGAMGIYQLKDSTATFAIINNFNSNSISQDYLQFLVQEQITYIFCIKATGTVANQIVGGHYYLYSFHFTAMNELAIYRVDGYFENERIECDETIEYIINNITTIKEDINIIQTESRENIHYIHCENKQQYQQKDNWSCGIYIMIYLEQLVGGSDFRYSFNVKEPEIKNFRDILKSSLKNEIDSLNLGKALLLLNKPSIEETQQTSFLKKGYDNETQTKETPNTVDKTTTKTPNTVDKTTTKTPNTVDKTTTKTPNTVDKTTTKTPNTADKTSTKTPNTVDKTTTKTPNIADKTSTKTPNTVDITTTKTPNTVDKTSTKTPNTVDKTTNESKDKTTDKNSKEKTLKTLIKKLPVNLNSEIETSLLNKPSTEETQQTTSPEEVNDCKKLTTTLKTVTQTQNEDSQFSENVNNQDNNDVIAILKYIKELEIHEKKLKYLQTMFRSPSVKLEFTKSNNSGAVKNQKNTNKETWDSLESFFKDGYNFKDREKITSNYEYSKNWILNESQYDEKDNTTLWQNHMLEMISQCIIFTGEFRRHTYYVLSCIILIDDNYETQNEKVGLIKYIQCNMKKQKNFFKKNKTNNKSEQRPNHNEDMVIFLSYMFAKVLGDENIDINQVEHLVLLLPKNMKDDHFIQHVTTETTKFQSKLTLTPMKEEYSKNYYLINETECEYAIIKRSEFKTCDLYNIRQFSYNAMDPTSITKIEQDPDSLEFFGSNSVRSDSFELGNIDETRSLFQDSVGFNTEELISNIQKKTANINKSPKTKQKKKRANAKLPTGTLSCNGLKIASNNDEMKAACSWLAMCKAIFYVNQKSGLYEKYVEMYKEDKKAYQYLYLDSSMAGCTCIRQQISPDLRKHKIKWENKKEKELSWILNTENVGVFILVLEEARTYNTTHCITLCRKDNKDVCVYDPYNDWVHFGEQLVNEELFHHLCGTNTNRQCKRAKVVIELSVIKNERKSNKDKKRKKIARYVIKQNCRQKRRKRNHGSSSR